MALTYRRPGVYLEESLLVNVGGPSGATSVAVFAGIASKGPINEPTLVESWSEYVTNFGGFTTVTNPDPGATNPGSSAISYLPYSVYSFFQNGGRTAYIIRSISSTPGEEGTVASKPVNGVEFLDDQSSGTAFVLEAKSVGAWGAGVYYSLGHVTEIKDGSNNTIDAVFTLQILLDNGTGTTEIVETWPNMAIIGVEQGTRNVATVINDPMNPSMYVRVSTLASNIIPTATNSPVQLTEDGDDPYFPAAQDMVDSTIAGVLKLDGPLVVNIAGYIEDVTTVESNNISTPIVWVGATVSSSQFTDRSDVFIVNDNCPPRLTSQSNSSYKSTMDSGSTLKANTGDSYSASYGPWILVPNPTKPGNILAVPPGGSVIGIMARIDATIGVFRAPAGVVAGLSNAVGVQTKFTDTEQGDLNGANINVIRSVVGAGIAIMGARTRKTYGADRYVSARRTLIYLRELLRRTMQFAIFENNDERLWSAMRMGADRILRGLWEAGGLRGSNSADAYYIRCDSSINTPSVIASGEVRMEVGVALEYPAEFVIIRVSQFDRASTVANEVTIA